MLDVNAMRLQSVGVRHAPSIYFTVWVKQVYSSGFFVCTVWRTNRAALQPEPAIAVARYAISGFWIIRKIQDVLNHFGFQCSTCLEEFNRCMHARSCNVRAVDMLAKVLFDGNHFTPLT